MCRLTKKTINYVLLQSVNRNEKQATCIKINQVWLKKIQVTLNDCAMVAFFNTIHDFWLSMTLILFPSEKFADQNHNNRSLTYAIWIVRLFPKTKNRITPFKVQFYNSFFDIFWSINDIDTFPSEKFAGQNQNTESLAYANFTTAKKLFTKAKSKKLKSIYF